MHPNAIHVSDKHLREHGEFQRAFLHHVPAGSERDWHTAAQQPVSPALILQGSTALDCFRPKHLAFNPLCYDGAQTGKLVLILAG